MPRKFTCLALFCSSLLAPLSGRAQTAALLVVGDVTQVSELQLAKVMVEGAPLWLSVRLQGPTRLALVTRAADVEAAPGANAWLRALDFSTRMRVAVPPGPHPSCGANMSFEVADSGLPEPRRLTALELSSANTELELRRHLANAGLPVDIDGIAQFTSESQPPFQVLIFDAPVVGGSTEALRLSDRSQAGQLPRIALSGAKSVPLALIALADQAVLPFGQESADPSEFPVTYRALESQSDYLSARRGWLAHNPTRWLNEVQASPALFAWTVLPTGGQIAPVVSRYFEQLSGTSEGTCEVRVRAAHVRASVNAADFVCDEADDLSRSLGEVGFADLYLNRLFGTLSRDGAKFRVAPSVARSPLSFATDFDESGCPPGALPPATAPGGPPESRPPPPVSTSPVVVDPPDDPYRDPTPAGTPTSFSDGGCSTGRSYDSRPNDSCSGSTAGDSRRDSCSGNSSSSDSSRDSCSGDSSSQDSGPDSCSGDSSDSSNDSAGCGQSEYDGDTCSGDSASGNSGESKSSSLRSGRARAHPRPRQVRLSLLTLLAAALALPLRRLRASR